MKEKQKLLMQTEFLFEDDAFVEEFCREAPVGSLPLDAHKRLLRGEVLTFKTGNSTTKIQIAELRLAKKKLH